MNQGTCIFVFGGLVYCMTHNEFSCVYFVKISFFFMAEHYFIVYMYYRAKTRTRNFIQIYHICAVAKKLGPSVTAFPGTWEGVWLGSKAAETRTSNQMICGYHRQLLYLILHSSRLTTAFLFIHKLMYIWFNFIS